jgi:uncharacterized protein (TIGR00369 family)
MQEPDDSPRHWCYGCGDRNPEGLGIRFEISEGGVRGVFTPRQSHQGYPGVAHGGIAAAALDEAMGWAMYAAGAWAMTAKMEVKYRQPLPLGEEVTVTARVVKQGARWLEARAEIRSRAGAALAEARGVFVRVPRERAAELSRFFLGDGSA